MKVLISKRVASNCWSHDKARVLVANHAGSRQIVAQMVAQQAVGAHHSCGSPPAIARRNVWERKAGEMCIAKMIYGWLDVSMNGIKYIYCVRSQLYLRGTKGSFVLFTVQLSILMNVSIICKSLKII